MAEQIEIEYDSVLHELNESVQKEDDNLLSGISYQTPSKLELEEYNPMSFQVSPSFQQSQKMKRNFDSQKDQQQQDQQPTPSGQKNIEQSFSLCNQSFNIEGNFDKIFEKLQKIEIDLLNQSCNESISEIRSNLNEIQDKIYHQKSFAQNPNDGNENLNLTVQRNNSKHIRTRSEASPIFTALQKSEQKVKEENSNSKKIPLQDLSKSECSKLIEIMKQDQENLFNKNQIELDKTQEVIATYYELRDKYQIKVEEKNNQISLLKNQLEQLQQELSQQNQNVIQLESDISIQKDSLNSFISKIEASVQEKAVVEKMLEDLRLEQSEKDKIASQISDQFSCKINQQEENLLIEKKKNEELSEDIKKCQNQIEQQNLQIQELQVKAQVSDVLEQNKQLQKISEIGFNQQRNLIYVLTTIFQQYVISISNNLNVAEVIKDKNNSFHNKQGELKQLIESENSQDKTKIIETIENAQQSVNEIIQIFCQQYTRIIEQIKRSREEFFNQL